jgi:hypothetical protein
MLANGFDNVRIAGGNRGERADVLAARDGNLWVTQCKNPSRTPPAAKAITEVVKAAQYPRTQRLIIAATSRLPTDAINRYERLGLEVHIAGPRELLQMTGCIAEAPEYRRVQTDVQFSHTLNRGLLKKEANIPFDFEQVDRTFHERLSVAPLEEHARILDEYRSARPDCINFSKWFLTAKYFVDIAASTFAQDMEKPSVRKKHRTPGPKTIKPYIRLLRELLIKYPHMSARDAYKTLDDLLAQSRASASSTLAHPTIAEKSFESWSAAYNDESVKGLLDSRCTRCRPKK